MKDSPRSSKYRILAVFLFGGSSSASMEAIGEQMREGKRKEEEKIPRRDQDAGDSCAQKGIQYSFFDSRVQARQQAELPPNSGHKHRSRLLTQSAWFLLSSLGRCKAVNRLYLSEGDPADKASKINKERKRDGAGSWIPLCDTKAYGFSRQEERIMNGSMTASVQG